MDNISTMSKQQLNEVKIILTDIDDTLTTEGRLKSNAYTALENLSNSGFIVIPVTGRCAGWCDHIARMWPVNGVVGENGAFFFSYDHQSKKMQQTYCQTPKERKENHLALHEIKKTILKNVSGSALASDQDYRHTDLAIDFAEDVATLSSNKIKEIVTIAENAGAIAKVSSIHVNCWIGSHNKLSTSLTTLEQVFGVSNSNIQNEVLFIGDSPNDSMMFDYFNKSVGVANVMDFIKELDKPPKYITLNHSGEGFVELADSLLRR
ncbi:MAG: HAD superfamily hydrolase (TIGR01484 family) [Bacteriovoracaceae bacterium]|jgi:HAD superfamily hydrolase (TIGR01484 family)|nr:HAD family phosphatase [Gammaproteobacteria bacterium]MBT5548142.1 HAD family phosphatase [Gammaproteobacteria bacterium]MDC1027336.1 HAD-IIB family hydrolase [Candidatus Thioglobus sp.]|tara:strand:- start:200 stop:991 length:792 start_codon:yes stop_codon:yes gene_type:complete